MNQHRRFREVQDLAYRSAVRSAEREGKNTLTQFYAKLGLTPAQAEIVCWVDEEGELTLADLARLLRVRARSLAQTMSDLAARGVVETIGSAGPPGPRCTKHAHPDFMGPLRYRLTAHGARAVETLGASLPAVHAEATAASREAFARQYARALAKYERDGTLGAPHPHDLN